MSTTFTEGLGTFATEFGGYIELHGNWKPVYDPEDAAALLMGVAGYLGNVEIPLLAAQEIAERDTKERFETETDPDETPWEELSYDYRLRKQEEGYPDIILEREGYLSTQAPHGWMVVGPNLVYDPYVLPKDSKGFSYGAAMQEGTRGKRTAAKAQEAGRKIRGSGDTKGVPPRPFIGLSQEAVAEIAAVFSAWADNVPMEVIGMGSNVLGEFPVVGGFYRLGGYQPLLKMPSGHVVFGKIR